MRGFSLVELSIVLVILGLLTGGILAGQNLIRAAELRSVSTQYQNYITATQTFRDKYFALPGDMRNATTFWSSATCPGTAGSGTETCDGNGDGNIAWAAAGSQYGESLMFWQHLANAGLIEGSYTGIAGSGGIADHVIGENSPRSKISTAGFGVEWRSVVNSAHAHYFEGNYDDIFVFGNEEPNTSVYAPVISPEEAWNIDTKMDDGRPAQGMVRAFKSTSTLTPNCTTTAVASTAEYNLTNSAQLCNLILKTGF